MHQQMHPLLHQLHQQQGSEMLMTGGGPGVPGADESFSTQYLSPIYLSRGVAVSLPQYQYGAQQYQSQQSQYQYPS